MSKVNGWLSNPDVQTSPASSAVSVTASADPLQYDGQDEPARALYVGVAGDVTVTTLAGETVTFAGIQGILPVSVTHVTALANGAASVLALR